MYGIIFIQNKKEEKKMGKVKSMLMEAQDELFAIMDVENTVCTSECFDEFAATLMTDGGLAYYDWAYKFGLDVERFVITDIWNEYWGAYA